MMIKFAIFDLDGTLCDTLDTIRHYVNLTIKKFGAVPISREECRQFIGRGARNLILRTMESRNMDMGIFEEVYAEYNRAYNANPYYLSAPFDGINEMLGELKARGIKLAVLSNKPQAATAGTVEYFFPNTFSAVFGGRDGSPLKPAKESIIEVLSALSADISETAYVGDSDVDVLTIKAADPALGIAVSYGFRTKEELLAVGANLILDTPKEVLECIIKKEA
jgi:phosphoglycolate phosphatase